MFVSPHKSCKVIKIKQRIFFSRHTVLLKEYLSPRGNNRQLIIGKLPIFTFLA